MWFSAAVGALLGLASAAKASPGYNPPAASGAGQRELRAYLDVLESEGILPGFEIFAQAVAKRESGFNTEARNTTASEARAARRLFDGARSRGHFAENPFLSDTDAWTFGSGGWFGFLPATGMAQGGRSGPFQTEHPSLIFDPAASLAMAAAYAASMIRNYGAKDWLAVRRGWAATGLVSDTGEEKQRSRDVRTRLVKDVQAVTGWSASEATRFVESPSKLGKWPGANGVYALLRRGGPVA